MARERGATEEYWALLAETLRRIEAVGRSVERAEAIGRAHERAARIAEGARGEGVSEMEAR